MIELDPHYQEAVTTSVHRWRNFERQDTFGAKNDTVGIVYALPQDIGPSSLQQSEAVSSAQDFYDIYTDKRSVRHQERGRRVRRLAGMTLPNIAELVNDHRVSHVELHGVGRENLLLDDTGTPIDWSHPDVAPVDLKQGDCTIFTFPHFMPLGQFSEPLLPPMSFGFRHPTNIRVTRGTLDPEMYGADDEIARKEALRTRGDAYEQPQPILQFAARITREQVATVDLDNPAAIAQMIERGLQDARRMTRHID